MKISTLPTTVLVILALPFGIKRGLLEEHQNWEMARDGPIAILEMPITIRMTLSTNSKKTQGFPIIRDFSWREKSEALEPTGS